MRCKLLNGLKQRRHQITAGYAFRNSTAEKFRRHQNRKTIGKHKPRIGIRRAQAGVLLIHHRMIDVRRHHKSTTPIALRGPIEQLSDSLRHAQGVDGHSEELCFLSHFLNSRFEARSSIEVQNSKFELICREILLTETSNLELHSDFDFRASNLFPAVKIRFKTCR